MKKYFYNLFIVLVSMLPFTAKAACVQPFVQVMDWHASESNSAWATTITSQNNTVNVIQSTANFNAEPAWKVGVLFTPENKYWNTTLYWTHYSTNSTKNINLNNQIISSLFFSGSYFISNDLYFASTANWNLNMNMVDLDVSHNFKPTPSVTLTPKIGLKGGSINQQINIDWNAILYNSTESVGNNFAGIGPSFGLDGKWNFYKELSIVGNISTALMYGRWNLSDTYQRPSAFFGLITPVTISTRANQSKLGAFMMDYFLGLEWMHQGQADVALRIGYEAQYWAGQLRLTAVQQLPTLGDLTLQGATCGISIGF